MASFSTSSSQGSRAWKLCLAALFSAQFSAGVVTTLILASFPTLRLEFDAGAHSGWIVTAYLLVAATSAALFGRLGDLLGRSKLLRFVLAVICMGGLVSATATSLWWLVAGTAMMGLTGAIIPLCMGLAREHGPPERLPSSIGLIIAAGMVGGFVGLFLGGLIVDLLGWSMVFVTGAVFVAATLAMVVLFVPPSRRSAPGALDGFDFLGALLFIPGITGILYAVSQASVTGWRDPATLIILLVSVAIQACWVWHELRIPQPLINVRLLLNRQVMLANLCMVCVAMGTMQVGQIMMIYFQQPLWTAAGFGLSATMAGVLLGPMNLIGLWAGPWAGRLAERFNLRIAMMIASVIIIAAWVCVMVWHDVLWVVMIALLVNAIGLTAAYTAIPGLIIAVVPHDRTSESTGLMVTTRALSQAVGAQVIVLILASQPLVARDAGASRIAMPGFMAVFGLVLAISIACLILAAVLPKKNATERAVGAALPGGNALPEKS